MYDSEEREVDTPVIDKNYQPPIVVTNGSDIAIAGTPTTYALNIPKYSDKLTYQWTVINDPVAIAREKKDGNPNPITEYVTFPITEEPTFEAPWAMRNHMVVAQVYKGKKLINTYSYQQQVKAANTNKLKSSTKEEKSSLLNVPELTNTQKLTEAVKRSASALPGELAEELQAILTGATLATMAAILAVYVAAHATGVGQAMDIGMLIAGGVFFGMDAFDIFKDIAGFANAVNAQNEDDLEIAGQHLASAVAKIGVDAIMTLLTKKVADEIGKTVDHVNQVDEVSAHSDDVTPSRANDVDNANSTNSKKPTTEEVSNTSSRQADEITSNSRSRRMNTGAKVGVDPSDYSIKVGTVRMKEHPNYQNSISEAKSKGFKVVEDTEARVSYIEVINKQKEVIAIEKELHVIPDMRYIDLEHEVGHIRQLERFDWKIYTDRYKQNNDGRRKLYNQNAPHVLQEWQDHITEYHNRLDEFLRLYERDANLELLLEHAEGISIWHEKQGKGTKWGKKKGRIEWIEQHFPDLKQLSTDYNQAIQQLRRNAPDLFDNIRLI